MRVVAQEHLEALQSKRSVSKAGIHVALRYKAPSCDMVAPLRPRKYAIQLRAAFTKHDSEVDGFEQGSG